MKVVLSYQCDEEGKKQKYTCAIDVRPNGKSAEITCDFDPPVSDSTSDPLGLLSELIDIVGRLAGVPEQTAS
jgi:hypothetical protein